MGIKWSDGGYSAEVEIFLDVHGARLRVAKVGAASLSLRDFQPLPATDAELVVKIDGQERRQLIHLLQGTERAGEAVQYI